MAGVAGVEDGVCVGGVRVVGVGLEVGPAPVAPVIRHLDAVAGDGIVAGVGRSGPIEVDLVRSVGRRGEAGRRAGDGDGRWLPGHCDGIGLHRAAGLGRDLDLDDVQHRRRVGDLVRVEFRGQGAGAHRESAQRREGPGGDDRHRDGVGAGRSKGRPVTVSLNARSPAVEGAVKLGRAVSAPVSVTGAPLACVHA